MRRLTAILMLISITSCSSWMSKEATASAKASAASDRINASERNSKDVFKELDQ